MSDIELNIYDFLKAIYKQGALDKDENKNFDPYKFLASKIINIPEEQVSYFYRNAAKSLFWCAAYGKSQAEFITATKSFAVASEEFLELLQKTEF